MAPARVTLTYIEVSVGSVLLSTSYRASMKPACSGLGSVGYLHSRADVSTNDKLECKV